MNEDDINESLAKRLISSQFPRWAHLPLKRIEVDGHDNRTFHLGEEMSIRLPTGSAYADHVPIEHKWLPKIAKHLALPITMPIAIGDPGFGYPWSWSVNRWIRGQTASRENIADFAGFAEDLADFLNTLQRIDATDAPRPEILNKNTPLKRGTPLRSLESQAGDVDSFRFSHGLRGSFLTLAFKFWLDSQ